MGKSFQSVRDQDELTHKVAKAIVSHAITPSQRQRHLRHHPYVISSIHCA
ncbi:hypothetical protein QM565_01580 [Geitlerinema splendidum]|nr:hypothetical protein [Geitlerinema splendidum]